MELVLMDDQGGAHVVADDRRLRALAEVCGKGWSRSADSAMEEMGAAVVEAAADAAGLPYAGVHGPAAIRAKRAGGPTGD